MGIKRVVDVDFWNDEKVMDMFSPEDKLFMLYLLTNPHTTQLGIYAINPKHMAFEIGYSVEVINVLLDRFESKYGMIKYSTQTKEIAIKNFLRHSIIKGGKPVEDCLLKELAKVKDKSLLQFVYNGISGKESLNVTVKKILVILNNEIQNENENDNDNENENEVSYHDTLTNRATNREEPKKEEKEVRHKYGEYKNVLLSDNDMEKLKAEFPQDYKERIERLSGYIAQSGKTYKSHLATIRNWARKDKEKNTQTNTQTINGKEYELKNGKYYIKGGSGIAVDPYAKDELPF
jgi:hypothetical protein